VLASQLVQPTVSNKFGAFTLDQGPPIFVFPAIPSNGLLPVPGPQCYQSGTLPASLGGGPSGQNCTQPHIRPTFQRLPALDAWNATVQRQVTSSTSLEVAYIGNHGSHGFAGDGNTYNVNGPSIVGYAAGVPQVQRRPYYNAFTYSGYPDPSSTTGSLMCCSTDQGNYLGNDASSIYNALQVKVDKRFNHS